MSWFPLFFVLMEECCSVAVSVRTAEGLALAGVAVRIESGAMRYAASTAENGETVFVLSTPGQYLATASAEGYASQTRQFSIGRDEKARIELILVRRDSVTVEGQAAPLDPGADAQAATGDQLRSLPERVADLRGALPLIPGVVRTPEGKLQIAGSPEYRSTFLVNSIDVTDPATGSFGATVPIDVVETVQVYKSPFLAEYGRFSAAVVAVTTRRGGDKWHFEVNDPTPEFRIRSGHIRGIRGFTPRFAATGPLVPGKLYFAGAGSFELRKRPVYPLPFPFNEEKSQRVNAYAQFDFVPRATHLITISAHGVPERANFVNLSFYTPQAAAASWRAHEFRGAVADRLETQAGVFESALSFSELRGRTGGQGGEPLALTPVTSLGNYFMTQDRRSQRAQFVETLSLKQRAGFGTHAFKLGGSLARTTLDGSASARAVRIDTLDALSFRNQDGYRLTDWDGSLFAQDGWQPFPLFRIDAGARIDLQRLAGVVTVAPRIGLAWMPAEAGRTVVRGGWGWFYDRVPLNVFAFPRYPERLALPNVLAQGGTFSPRSRTVSAAADHRLSSVLLLHGGFIQSVHSRLVVAKPESNATVLAGSGRARTRELEVTAKLTWYSEQQWILSYVHTRGRGNLNGFDRFLGDFPEPLLRADTVAGLAGVAPHRFLTWGVFPVAHGLRFAPVVEWRSGFPYSALDRYQQYSGVPNSLSLPTFFSLDTRVSKDVALKGHKVRLSFSMFNVTNHANFDAVRLNTADPQFGEVLGRRPRRFRVDFDWLF